jgi:lysozyme family protein
MAAENYQKCLEAILHHEGGYVNHPKDPGGETNLGMTKRVYEEWCKANDLYQKDMKDLIIEDVAPIYRKNYWDRVKGDRLPNGLDLCVFDFGVNAGTGRGAKFLQAIVGAGQDGAIGPGTLGKVEEYLNINSVEEAIMEYQHRRQNYYQSLKTFGTFGRGWTRRVNETTEMALEMLD